MTALAWLDGRLVPRDEARVPVDDLGFLYGAACFETMLARYGRAFRLDAHLARLTAGLDAMGAATPPGLREAIDATLEANRLRDARVRLTVTAGRGGRPVLGARGGGAEAGTVLVTVEPLGAHPLATLPPARLAVASTRLDERRPLAGTKHANFLGYLLARQEAAAAGADEALLLNHRGHVAEAGTANIFAVAGGTVRTPPLDDGPLAGITRLALLECAQALGLPAEECSMTLEALLAADELVLANSLVGARPVAVVLDETGAERWRREAPGPVTTRLAEAYEALVEGECGKR